MKLKIELRNIKKKQFEEKINQSADYDLITFPKFVTIIILWSSSGR